MKTAIADLYRGALKTSLDVRLALAAVVLLLCVWWPTLTGMAYRWGEAQYSHGFLVPLFSLFLLWARQDKLPRSLPKLTLSVVASGLALLASGLGLHFIGTYIYFDWLSAASLLVCLAGVCLLTGGWQGLNWAWPAIAFLLFMVPLPYQVEIALGGPLRGIATRASTYALQTLGFAAFREGNVIHMGEIQIGIVEACSGLSMLMIFFALSTAVALLSKGTSVLEKCLICLSALPIALIANMVRIVFTGIMHRVVGSEWADYFFHDLAGWLMMFLALGMLWVGWRLFAWVVKPVTSEDQKRFNVSSLNSGWQRPERAAAKTPPRSSETKRKTSQPKP
jgi:exosortase